MPAVANERVRFYVQHQGKLVLGSLQSFNRTEFHLTDLSSTMDVHGGLFIDIGSSLQAVAGATVSVSGDFGYRHTDPTQVQLDQAILTMDGSGDQLLEVGNKNLGVGGATSGNFGIGQLVIGTTTRAQALTSST